MRLPFLVVLVLTAFPAATRGETLSQPATSTSRYPRQAKKPAQPLSSDKAAEVAEQAVLLLQNPDAGSEVALPTEGRISSEVGLRRDPINGVLRIHNGIDIAVPEGTPVKPVAPGKVIYSGTQPGYGHMVVVRHDDGMITVYAHHSRNVVHAGQRVGTDTLLAYSGSTGHSTGPHLHFEAWQGKTNITSAYLPRFAGRKISGHEGREGTALRKIVLPDGTILFAQVEGGKTGK